jgi:spermidine synthase
MGVSTHLTQNISSAPLLWVIPLALYLLTFIICFDHPRWYVRGVYLPLGAVCLALMAWLADSLDLALAAPIYATGLFVLCMVCHGELHGLRPEPQRLTQFYLAMAAGGALGSLLMGVVAPHTLAGHFEFQIVLILLASLGFILRPEGAFIAGHISLRQTRILAAVVLAGVCTFNWHYVDYYRYQVRTMERDFYGVVRTRDREGGGTIFRNLVHGGIAHGGQHQREELQMTGASYFGPSSGYGRVFRSLEATPRRVGVIGLGAGALAVYAQAGDHWVFYEISPAVVRAATTEFSFLARMQGTREIVLGDGRLALEREAPRQFDVIAMDAFAGDSIPVHFLTREAMALYLKHLKPDGVIVFQATNRFVNPMPVIRQLADTFGLQAILVSDSPDHSEGPEYWLSSTDQVIVTSNAALLQAAAVREVAQAIAPIPGLDLFTDDYVNLLRILKR